MSNTKSIRPHVDTRILEILRYTHANSLLYGQQLNDETEALVKCRAGFPDDSEIVSHGTQVQLLLKRICDARKAASFGGCYPGRSVNFICLLSGYERRRGNSQLTRMRMRMRIAKFTARERMPIKQPKQTD